MKKYSIVLRTIQRIDRENYLLETLRNLERAGLTRTRIPYVLQIVDGGTQDHEYMKELARVVDTMKATILHHIPAKLTPNENAAKALKHALEPDADYIIFLEDDLDFCANWLESVDAWLAEHFENREDRKLVSFCAAYPQAKEDKPAWDYTIKSFYGTQCYVLRMEDAKSCAAYMEAHPLYRKKGSGHDMLLKQWAKKEWPKIDHFLSSAPSFVQHIGKESTLHLGRFHDYASWPGREWSYAPALPVETSGESSDEDLSPWEEQPEAYEGDPVRVEMSSGEKYEVPAKVVPPGAHTLEQQKKRYFSPRLTALIAASLPKERWVYDLGCGAGHYIEPLEKAGFDIIGIEGTPGIKKVAVCNPDRIIEHDLTKPITGDCPPPGSVICLEVAEHIPPEYEDAFLANVSEFCRDYLILSWAIKGQGGHGHVNEQNWDYVVKRMRKLGFIYNRTESLRWREEAGKDLKWFKHSLYIFRRA